MTLKFPTGMIFPSTEQSKSKDISKAHVINTQKAKQVNV